jgi:hypothetical protein
LLLVAGGRVAVVAIAVSNHCIASSVLGHCILVIGGLMDGVDIPFGRLNIRLKVLLK